MQGVFGSIRKSLYRIFYLIDGNLFAHKQRHKKDPIPHTAVKNAGIENIKCPGVEKQYSHPF